MTEPAPGATADLMPAPSTPADQAIAKIAQLKADPDFVKRHLGGDHQTKEELARLHELAYAPAQGSIAVGGPTPEAQWAETAAHLETIGDLSAAIVEEIRQGKPAGREEYRLALGRKRSLMSDPVWVGKYMNNGAAERREMLLLDSIISRGMRLT